MITFPSSELLDFLFSFLACTSSLAPFLTESSFFLFSLLDFVGSGLESCSNRLNLSAASLLLLFPESLLSRVSSIGSASSRCLELVSSLNLTISLLSSRSLCSSNCLARWSCSSACFNCCLMYQSLSSFPTLFLFSSYSKSSDWNLSKPSV